MNVVTRMSPPARKGIVCSPARSRHAVRDEYGGRKTGVSPIRLARPRSGSFPRRPPTVGRTGGRVGTASQHTLRRAAEGRPTRSRPFRTVRPRSRISASKFGLIGQELNLTAKRGVRLSCRRRLTGDGRLVRRVRNAGAQARLLASTRRLYFPAEGRSRPEDRRRTDVADVYPSPLLQCASSAPRRGTEDL